jgi:hypothetical protein
MRMVWPLRSKGFTTSVDRRHLYRSWRAILLTLVLALTVAACGPYWRATVASPDGGAFEVDAQVLKGLSDFSEQLNGIQAIPLERVLVSAGHLAVDRLVAIDAEGARHEFEWASVADQAWWLNDGRLSIGGEEFAVSDLQIDPPELLVQVEASITDIAPTVALALGLPPPAQATGQVLQVSPAEQVVLIFLDGFGYVRYTEAKRDGLIPNISALAEPLVGMTTYAPITSVSTASLLTGAPPEVHGVDRRGIRKTEMETLLDVAMASGLEVVAIEGESLSFQLRNSEMQLSGDLDGNGSTDDNVLLNALAALRADIPDIFFVHFHGIDDAGHTYSPGAPEECAAISEEDSAVGRIIDVLPSNTLIIIFADHGMHAVQEEEQMGNHGHLIERDMFIPIFVVLK